MKHEATQTHRSRQDVIKSVMSEKQVIILHSLRYGGGLTVKAASLSAV